jgi:hypothetical protein
MAKKLTKAQIAKNPTKAINSGKMKMRKQEVPFGGIGKAAVKVVGKVLGKKTVAKGGSRQAGDYAVSGKSAKQTMIKVGSSPTANYRYGRDAMISKNVTIKDTTSPSGKQFIRGGASQVMNQNSRLTTKLTKAEVKANARGLKAANKPTKSTKTKPFAKGSASRGSAKEIARIATIAGGSALGITSTKSYQTNLQGQIKDAQKAKQSKKKSK